MVHQDLPLSEPRELSFNNLGYQDQKALLQPRQRNVSQRKHEDYLTKSLKLYQLDELLAEKP